MDGDATIPHLRFFPSRLPDETLHSRVSRFHTLSGNLDDRHTLQDAFGSHTLVATSHLPSHLNALSSRLPDGVCSGVDELLGQATLFPYFRLFLQPAQVEHCRAAMCGNNAGRVKVAIGLVASRIGGRNAFRFCHECCVEDAQRHGITCWHRAHQLPGVRLCVVHGVSLVEVHASWLRSHRHNLFLPMPAQFAGCLSEHSIPASHSAYLSKCAALSVELLGLNHPPLDRRVLRSFYRDCAARQGWIDVYGRVCAAAVQRSAKEFCDQLPLDQDFEFIRDERWIFRMLHKHRGSMHPLKHVAMLILLKSDWLSLLSYCQSHPAPPTPVSPRRRSICSPRDFTAPVNSPQVTRPKTLKGGKLSALNLALATTDSLQQIAQAHDVSLASLYRILRREPAVAAERNDRYRDWRRKRFIEELRSTPPRRTLDYMWLYRNDRAWLDQQTACKQAYQSRATQWRVDWNKRDLKLAQTVQHLAVESHATVPPTRVSTAMLARATGRQATLEKYASRLPLTMATLAEVAESVEEFQCRRLEWAAEQLRACGRPFPPWQILRMAGIELPLSQALVGCLSQVIDN